MRPKQEFPKIAAGSQILNVLSCSNCDCCRGRDVTLTVSYQQKNVPTDFMLLLADQQPVVAAKVLL